jgi:outer membrane protein TolC
LERHLDYFTHNTCSFPKGECLILEFTDDQVIKHNCSLQILEIARQTINEDLKMILSKKLIRIKNILFAILIFNGCLSGFSQNEDQFDPLKDDIIQKLLPLNDLIDSAILHDPYVRFRDLQVVVNQCKLKAEQSNWLRNLGVQSDIRYGTFNNFSTNTAEGQNPDIFATQTSQWNWGVGAYLKFPIIDFVERKNQVNLAKTEIEQAESMSRFQQNEVRQLVIKQYNELVLKQNILKIKAKYLALISANNLLVEKEFQNGVADLSEYTRISGIYFSAQTEFEVARIEFITTYMLLEEIVGFKFNSSNTN